MQLCRGVSRGGDFAEAGVRAGRGRGAAACVEGLECRRLLAAALPPDPLSLLTDIIQTTKDSTPQPAAELGGQVLFSADTREWGRELWITTGSGASSGARLFADVLPELPQDAGWYMHEAGGRLWFYGRPSTFNPGMEPWVSDGTAAGTLSLGDLNPGDATSLPNGVLLPQDDPRFAAGPDGYVYFRAFRPDIGVELFRSDGTPEGTGLVADIVPGPTGSFPG